MCRGSSAKEFAGLADRSTPIDLCSKVMAGGGFASWARPAGRSTLMSDTRPVQRAASRKIECCRTYRHISSYPATQGAPEAYINRSPVEGVGNAGRPMHPRPVCKKNAHGSHHESTGNTRHSRTRMVLTAYSALSPATNSSCHRHRRIEGFAEPGRADQNLRRLDTSNGCQDHTVLPSATRLRQEASPACARPPKH